MIRISNLIPAKSSTTPCIPVEQMVVGVTSSKSHVSTQMQIQQCQASTFLHRISLNYVPSSPFKKRLCKLWGEEALPFSPTNCCYHRYLCPAQHHCVVRSASVSPWSNRLQRVRCSTALTLTFIWIYAFFCVLPFASPCTPALHTGTLRKPSSFNQGGCSTVSAIFSHHQLGYYMV